MIIKDLQTLKEFFNQHQPLIFGAGVYAFDRLGMEKIIPDYRIIALRHSLDTKLIEEDVKILSLEKGMGTKHIQEARNATTVISRIPKTKEYIEKIATKNPNQLGPFVLVYKPSKKMEETCEKNGWKLIANPFGFGKELLENKIKFREILQEIGIPVPSGKIASIDKLHYGHLINKYGLPFVIQHPTRGGGKGTFFINNRADFEKAIENLESVWNEDDEQKVKEADEVVVAKFIDGPSPSIAGCVTKYGILTTSLQYQVLDIPELYNPEKGSGLFCGHDWTSSHFSESVSKQAFEYTEKIGEYFKKLGYQGIFGLDFVLNKKTDKLYVVECNPRLVGTLPTVNMAQLLNNEVPILACHVLEFLGVDYQIDIEAVNQSMRQEKRGAHMFVRNLTGRWAKNHRQLKAGVYKLTKENSLKYLRPGYDLCHLENNEEFLLADGVPLKKSHFSPNRRLCRVLTLNSLLDETDYKKLNPWATQVAQTVYGAFQIKPVRFVKIKKFFAPNFLAKG
ncbi:ATP-grasp domain-containing protein [Patescibacteria group bacterium]|nr:ATP-grasp domain-containing protein [Patescibacteria group bacterium]MBU2579652.1 ATP-grasp domain-containing protein [Patescibacteria group bacterium]